MTLFWLWIGFISMTAGALFFGFKASRTSSERWRILLTLNFFITAIAAVLYLSMMMGQGVGIFYGQQSYWVRYLTWFLSTPLLLVVLTFLGRTRLSTVGGLLGADALMIATGFVATTSPTPINYVWYLVSCGAFAGILYLLLVPYRTEAEQIHPGSMGKQAFQRLLKVHVVLWTAYPIVWILADTGVGLLSNGFEALLYTLLDITAKVGFGFLSLNTFQKLEKLPAWADTPERTLSVAALTDRR